MDNLNCGRNSRRGKRDQYSDRMPFLRERSALTSAPSVEATPKNMKDIQLKKQNEARIAEAQLKEAQAFAKELEEKTVTVGIKVGAGGKTFGSVSTKEIADAAKEQFGIELDRKKMVLASPLRELGESSVQVRVHPKVTAQLKVLVKEI